MRTGPILPKSDQVLVKYLRSHKRKRVKYNKLLGEYYLGNTEQYGSNIDLTLHQTMQKAYTQDKTPTYILPF